MQEKINTLSNEINEKLSKITSIKELNELRTIYLSKKGQISELMNYMKELDNDSKKEFGKIINEFKTNINNSFDKLKEKLETEEINQKLQSEKIDISLPATKIQQGAPNILEKLIEEVEEIFISMGYDVVDGPEIEEDKYNFEMLNIPKGHPARDAQDTFYIEGEEILLRSQTSPVQVRTMLKGEGKTPIRMICPGKTYRRDDDATHSHQFGQFEGLVIDENITLSDLKGTLEIMARHMLGEKTNVRFRPSYFPFTEPSFEVDVTCFNCHGKGCNLCKQTGFIELLGAGMVHPNVLKDNGYDPNKYTGFAFGTGIDRLAMMKYGITDIRYMYTNDIRFLKQFTRDGE